MTLYIPENFVTRHQAAEAMGITEEDSHFIKLWEEIVRRSGVVFDSENINGKPITMTKHGKSFTITCDNVIPRVYEPKGEARNDIFMAKASIPALEAVYFAYAPYTSHAPSSSEYLTKAQTVSTEGTKWKKRAQLFVAIPPKTESFLGMKEIANYFGVAESVISERIYAIKMQYEEYWILENRFERGQLDAKPSPVITGEFQGKAINKGENTEYSLRISDDIGLMRYDLPDRKNQRQFCLRKTKLAEVFPDLFLLTTIKKAGIEFESGDDIYTPRVFSEKFLLGIGKRTMPQMANAIKKQYDELILSGKTPNDKDWDQQLIWVEERPFPASVFCYGEINKKKLFCIRAEAVEHFKKLPEVQVRNPETNIGWFNIPRLAEFFNTRLAKIDSEAQINRSGPKIMSFFEEILVDKIRWLTEARNHFFNPMDTAKPRAVMVNDREIKPNSVCIAMLNGGQPGCFLKHKAMLETIDINSFLPQRFCASITPLQFPTRSRKPENANEHWLSFARKVQADVAPQYRALTGNLAIILLAQMVEAQEEGLFFGSGKEEKTVFLNAGAKSVLLEKIVEKAKELYGYELEVTGKVQVHANAALRQ